MNRINTGIVFDAAEIYVNSKSKSVLGRKLVLNQAVRHNKRRLPDDFMFQLTETELKKLGITFCDTKIGRNLQTAVGFTEQVVAMFSSARK